ncbi:MAG: hypothetical protein HYS34_09420 [Acidobacteria bacterium]|nr:hypothetical protein [Acidobacteriota bacterium]
MSRSDGERLARCYDDVAFRRVDQRLASRLLRHREPIAITHQMLAEVSPAACRDGSDPAARSSSSRCTRANFPPIV